MSDAVTTTDSTEWMRETYAGRRKMPSGSPKQHNFMALCKHNPEHARGECPPESVAEEFLTADRRKHEARKRAVKGMLKDLHRKGD